MNKTATEHPDRCRQLGFFALLVIFLFALLVRATMLLKLHDTVLYADLADYGAFG
jgi:hypothetical protein